MNRLDSELFELLEEKYNQYNSVGFIETDPVSIPHLFSGKEDIEISGLLTALISWGQRPVLIRNARNLMRMMDDSPYDFVMQHSKAELKPLERFVHRTFNGRDCIFFVRSLRTIYRNFGSMEAAFVPEPGKSGIKEGIIAFRKRILGEEGLAHSRHISDPSANSAAKRINMFLRWMVRSDSRGVDFGIWKSIIPPDLMCPLDVHSGNVARKLGLLSRRQDDWKAVEELTAKLREFDPLDPVKYDFALFGMGVFEGEGRSSKL